MAGFFASDVAFWGPWYRFSAGWWQARSQDNVLFMRFEDWKADPNRAIENIAAFLGVSLTSEQVQRVANQTSFATMKKMNDKFYPVRQTIWSSPGGRIIRKGEVGDGDALFSHSAVEQFNARMAKGLSQMNCDFPFYALANKGANALQDATV
ncbi:MAG: sulfotransferase domain-containing protein [Pseudomonadota bacterium]